ncbi:TPA: hypothetical protein ACF3XN_003002 [Vibrio parahaemolyticus]
MRESWHIDSNDVGLNFGSEVRNYNQVNPIEIEQNYIKWYLYYDDELVNANDSWEKAIDDSMIVVNFKPDEIEQEQVNPEFDESQFIRKKNKYTNDSNDIKW